MPRGLFAILLQSGVVMTAMAQEGDSPDKSHYNLFHRTPRSLRRPLTTDRPDRTESPYTVDAGLFQVEADLFTYGRDASADGQDGVSGESFAVAPINLKAGLLHNVDLQFVLVPYSNEQTGTGAAATRTRGLGAVAVRSKVNLWGNDRGRTAFAVMPFVALVNGPGGGRLVNLGVVLPLRVDLGAGWGLGTMLEFDLARDEGDVPLRLAAAASASLGHGVTGPLSFYVELYGRRLLGSDPNGWEGTADLGLTLGIGSNLQLDAGLNAGLSRAAEDLNPFVGLAVRF